MSPNRHNRVNMADVARESGVSLSTVSMVFGDKPGLPAETRHKVLNAARALGYQSRSVANGGAIASIKTIGLIVKAGPEEAPRANQFYSHVIVGVEAACRQRSLNLLFASINVDADNRPLEVPQMFQKNGADGFLIVGTNVGLDLAHQILDRSLPAVLVDGYCEENLFDAVISDNFLGAYQSVEYLIKQGHRNIGFIGGFPDGYPSLMCRREGYLKALKDNNIPGVFFANSRVYHRSAVEATADLLRAHPEVTALVGVCDESAIGAMHAITELGKRVGDDISVVGFDDILMSEGMIPPLTTMQVDKLNMGRMAVQLLLNRAELPESALMKLILRPRLIERNSVKPLTQLEIMEKM
jgi:LacI family transcriptional regulator